MKSFRPHKAGFIVLYVLAALCIGDALYSLVTQILGTANPYMQSFSLFSYLIAALAVVFVHMYGRTVVQIDDKTMHFIYPVYIKPREGEKRAFFIFRQGNTDLKLVNKRFALADLLKYGYIEDLGYAQLDASGADEKNKFFPVHEIALVMKDGKRYHMNGGYYNAKQLTGIVEAICAATQLAPEGKLGKLIPQKSEGQTAD